MVIGLCNKQTFVIDAGLPVGEKGPSEVHTILEPDTAWLEAAG